MSHSARDIAHHGALACRVVDRMMQFRTDRVSAILRNKRTISDHEPDGLSRFDEAKAIIAIVSAHRGPTGIDSCGDAGEGERLYGLTAGHVLTEADIRDIEVLIADHNEEIGNSADKFQEARVATLHEIGGPALVAAVEANDQAIINAAVEKAMARFAEQSAQFAGGAS